MFDVRAHFGKWILVGAMAAAPVGAEVIFEENFDDQPDWTGGMHPHTKSSRFPPQDIIPEGWFAARHDPTWAPSKGHPDRHEALEILSSNVDKARGGEGKSMVHWRDSYDPGWNRWNSESLLLKRFPGGYDELYVEFWIRFSPEWTDFVSGRPSATSKVFRVYSSDETRPLEDTFQYFEGGVAGPNFLWDYSANSYGVRNRLSFSMGPHGYNLHTRTSDIDGLPRSLVGTGDMSAGFYSDSRGMALGGEDPSITDKLNGGLIDDHVKSDGIVTHAQIFGSDWTKMAFYVRMNSAPGEKDGVAMQWIDDQRIFFNNNIPWVKVENNPELKMVKWNTVGFGGNDFFQIYPNELRHEEWYSVDDIVVRTSIPSHLLDGSPELSPPEPPAQLKVE